VIAITTSSIAVVLCQTIVIPIMQHDSIKKIPNPFVVIPNESPVLSTTDKRSQLSRGIVNSCSMLICVQFISSGKYL